MTSHNSNSTRFSPNLDFENHEMDPNLSSLERYDYGLSDEMDFNSFTASPSPSELLAYMADKVPNNIYGHDRHTPRHQPDEFSGAEYFPISDMSSMGPISSADQTDSHKRSQTALSCFKKGKTCMSSALGVLQALHMPPSICLSSGTETAGGNSKTPRMTDSVLATNREAMRLVFEMLECQCSLDSQLQLVLTSICGKLTAWYRAIGRRCHDGLDSSRKPAWSAGMTGARHEDHSERVFQQPITIGEYSFDTKLQNKILIQVVFNELDHVETLIKALASRVEDCESLSLAATASPGTGATTLTAASEAARPSEGAAAAAVDKSLTVFLQKQLQAVKAEMASIVNLRE